MVSKTLGYLAIGITHFGQSLLIVAAMSINRALVKHLLSLPDVDISLRDRSGKRAIDYVRGDSELLADFKRVSLQDLQQVTTNFQNFKGVFFDLFTARKESDCFLEQLRQEPNEARRFELAQNYVRRNRNEALAQALVQEVPALGL